MPEYRVKRQCGWGQKSWSPGQTIADGEVPADVAKVLLARDAVEAARGPARAEAEGAVAETPEADRPEDFNELPQKGRKRG